MRYVLILILGFQFAFGATREPKIALTSGSKTITMAEDPLFFSAPPNELTFQQGHARETTSTEKNSPKSLAIVISGILIAVAIYFIARKNPAIKNFELTGPKLETESENAYKKEVWDKLAAEQDSHENA